MSRALGAPHAGPGPTTRQPSILTLCRASRPTSSVRRVTRRIGIDTPSGGEGYDTAYADDSQGPIGLNFNLAGTGIEAVWGGRGADFVDASGVPANINGIGVALYGNAGGDTLIGSAFSDLIEGGLGDDTLTGGLGADSFVFNLNIPGGGRDIITDFEDGSDTLDIWDPTTNAYLGYADVTVEDSADGAVVTYADGQIVLQGIAASQIDQDDFLI